MEERLSSLPLDSGPPRLAIYDVQGSYTMHPLVHPQSQDGRVIRCNQGGPLPLPFRQGRETFRYGGAEGVTPKYSLNESVL